MPDEEGGLKDAHELTADPFRTWLSSPLGQRCLEAEAVALESLACEWTGDALLWCGHPPSGLSLDACQVKVRFLASADTGSAFKAQVPAAFGTRFCARFEQLPLASSSVETVVLQHALELAQDAGETPGRLRAQQAMKEGARVLAMGGQLVVLGYNPLSLWGLRGMVDGWARAESTGDLSRLIAPNRLRDWLQLLDLELLDITYLMSSVPLRSGNWPGLRSHSEQGTSVPRLANWQRLPVGGIYILRARKTGAGANLIRPVVRLVPSTPGHGAAVGDAAVLKPVGWDRAPTSHSRIGDAPEQGHNAGPATVLSLPRPQPWPGADLPDDSE